MKPRLHDLYLLAPTGWPAGYHPTACYYCGRLIMQVKIVGRCEAGGALTVELDPAGEWLTATGSPLWGPKTACARFKRKEAQPHDPVRLEQCGTCDAWLPPAGTETVEPGAHAAYEGHRAERAKQR
jgi:hypothetical protein